MNAFADNSDGETPNVNVHAALARTLATQLVKTTQFERTAALDIFRCFASVTILDCMYGQEPILPPLSTFTSQRPHEALGPPLPTPPRVPAARDSSIIMPEDEGIYGICIDLYEVWSKATSFVESVRQGAATNFWTPQSPYNLVRTALLEFETRMSSNHRLRDIGFVRYTPDEIAQAPMYWRLWFTSQVLFHAIQLIINHPFVHMINGKRLRKFQPPSFQQQTIDQTLLHAKWIVRLHQMRKDKGLEVDDPFIAHLSAVAATTYVFFLDSPDPKVNLDARRGLEDCRATVAQLARKWKHLERMVRHPVWRFLRQLIASQCKLLDLLATSKTDKQSQRTARISWFWDLVSYCRSTSAEISGESTEMVTVNMTTQFTSPIDDPDTHQTEHASEAVNGTEGGLDIDLGLDHLTEPWTLAFNGNLWSELQDTSAPDVDPQFWFNLGQL